MLCEREQRIETENVTQTSFDFAPAPCYAVSRKENGTAGKEQSMERFIPYEKLSKKKQRELDLKKRGSWGGLNPVTRKPLNPKAYDRRKAQSWKKESGPAPFVYSLFTAG